MLTGFIALAIFIVKLFPNTAFVRSPHLYMVELPVELAQRFERRHIILGAILILSFQSFAMIGAADLAIVYAAEMSIYADAALAGYLTVITTRLKTVWAVCKRFVRRASCFRPRQRRRSARVAARKPRKPSNDDHPAWPQLPLAA